MDTENADPHLANCFFLSPLTLNSVNLLGSTTAAAQPRATTAREGPVPRRHPRVPSGPSSPRPAGTHRLPAAGFHGTDRPASP